MRLMRELLDPSGSALDSDNSFYIRREPDYRLEEWAKGKARTVVIKAPNQSGKSSLMRQYSAQCLAAGKAANE
jgi:predicted AAA+ superfamily ATPase